MFDDVSNRLARTGSKAFAALTVNQAVHKVFKGWDEAVIPDASLRASNNVYVYTRDGTWAALMYPAFDWDGLSPTARHRSLLNLFRQNKVVEAVNLPDLLDGMAAQANGNAFSPWVMAALQVANHPCPESEATATLLALGGCGSLQALHQELTASLEKMRDELAEQFAAVEAAKKKHAATV